jgi:hypothetical protein
MNEHAITLSPTKFPHLGAILLSASLGAISQGGSAAAQTLIGLDYASATGQNEIRSIDTATGQTTLLNSFTFDSGTWVEGTVVSNPSAGKLYVESGAQTLYTFDLASGEILSTAPLQMFMQALIVDRQDRLIGIDYSSNTRHNEIRLVNPNNGNAVLLNSFSFDSGTWVEGTVVSNPSAGKLYVESGAQTLYTFDLASGQILSTVPLDTSLQALAVDAYGLLIGIDYLSATGQNELRRVDPTTGKTRVLNTFAFDSGGWVDGTIVPNLPAGKLYIESSLPTLYTFGLVNGQTLSTVPLDTFMEALALNR